MELELIGDRYELGEPIGRGGMATIYRANDLRMGRVVAVKILREVYSSDPKFVTRFQREARAASALQHPNIVQVFDYGQSGESYYIVMEFVDGSDLRRYMKKRNILDPVRAIEIAHDVALGLGAAHRRGIVHRDVKPQNVLVNDDGLVKLTDFGIASMYKDAEAERLTTTGMTLGTVQYYAPEQAQGEIVSPAADIYALGIVLYEMLTGRTPFDGDTPVAVAMRHIQEIPEAPSRINPNIPPALERIIMRCLEKDPRDRYRDGDALAYALENALQQPGGRRTTGVGQMGPSGPRAPFAPPIGLPSAADRDPRAVSNPRPGSGFGGPAVASGPRGAGYGAAYGGGMDDETYGGETYGDFPQQGSPNTRPYGPAAGTVPRMPGTNGSPSRPNRPDEQKNNNTPLIIGLAGGALVLLVLACVTIAIVSRAFGGTSSANTQPTATATVVPVTVPKFIGLKSCDEATTQATKLSIKVDCTTTKKDDADKGTVVDQSPSEGQTIPTGGTVKLTISAGKDTVTVPNVSSGTFTLSQACDTLAKAQLVCNNVTQQASPTVPAGNVISQSLAAGSQQPINAPVDLVISTGPAATPTPTVEAPTASPTKSPIVCPTAGTQPPCP